MSYQFNPDLATFSGLFPLEIRWYNANSKKWEIHHAANEAERNLFIAEKDSLLLAQVLKDFRGELDVMLARKDFTDKAKHKVKQVNELLFIYQSALSGIEHYVKQIPNCAYLLPFDPIVINECSATIAQSLKVIDLSSAIRVTEKAKKLYALLVNLSQKAFNRNDVELFPVDDDDPGCPVL